LGVTTGKVAASAITADGIYSSDTVIALAGAEEVIATLTVSTNGGTAVVIAKFQVNLIGSTSPTGIFRIRKDSITGTVLDRIDISGDSTAAILQLSATLIGRDASPAATQTYKLTGEEGSDPSVTTSYHRLFVINAKK
jgi:hypothetical protein